MQTQAMDKELLLKDIDDGKLLLAADDLLREIALDIKKRCHIEKQREVNIKIKAKQTESGRIDISYKVTPKTPESLPELDGHERRQIIIRHDGDEKAFFEIQQLEITDAAVHHIRAAQ